VIWREIEVFRALMSAGSAAKAAGLMGVTQPAVSQSLKRLEAVAGFRLFDRLRGRLHPTPEARALLVEVERSFVGLSTIEHRLHSLRRYGVNALTVASYPAFGLGFMPRALARLVEELAEPAPRPLLSLQVLSSRDVRDRVLAGQADFGLMADELPTTGLEQSTFGRWPGMVVMHARHRWARLAQITPNQLSEEPFLALNPEDASRRRLERALAEHGVQLRVVAETPYAASVCELALNRLGVGIVNPITALDFARRGLVIRPLALETSFACLLVMTPGRPLSALAQRCLRLMRLQMQQDEAELLTLLQPARTGRKGAP
jgi:DNA-binding transcriptional LysR family regulator